MTADVLELTRDEIIEGLVRRDINREAATRAADAELARRRITKAYGNVLATPETLEKMQLGGLTTRVVARGPVEAAFPWRVARSITGEFALTGGHLVLGPDGSATIRLDLAPRSKKNHTTLGIRQSKPYREYRDAIIATFAPLHLIPGLLPLPEAHYNIAAHYFVDRYGKTADKVGLDQGLYDALENAGVVSDDWFFRTADGTRIVPGDPRPRVVCTITPIGDSR